MFLYIVIYKHLLKLPKYTCMHLYEHLFRNGYIKIFLCIHHQKCCRLRALWVYIGFGILKFKYHQKVKFKNFNSLIQMPVEMKKSNLESQVYSLCLSSSGFPTGSDRNIKGSSTTYRVTYFSFSPWIPSHLSFPFL